jgi:hypothetical protein
MSYLPDFWFAWGRHRDLLQEADRERWSGQPRCTRKAGERETPVKAASAAAPVRTEVRRGLGEDQCRVAELLELCGIPRWVAFEERFILAERDERVVAVLHFRQDLGLLHLGLLVADPRVEEGALEVSLYTGARKIARELGVKEVRAGTQANEAHLARAGYRKGSEGWRLDVEHA